MPHLNNGSCLQCAKILNRYPDFSSRLRNWFSSLQALHFEAHVSCGGRGKVDQEAAFQRGASRAHYGQSAHNYNAAMDLFCLTHEEATWPKEWFDSVVAPHLTEDLEWYGEKEAVFFELPHVQLREWKSLKDSGVLKIVE